MDMRAAFDDTIELAKDRQMWAHEDDLMLRQEGMSFEHILYMRSRITPDFSEAKLGRWLGWVQCAVVASGVATLDDMNDINRRHT